MNLLSNRWMEFETRLARVRGAVSAAVLAALSIVMLLCPVAVPAQTLAPASFGSVFASPLRSGSSSNPSDARASKHTTVDPLDFSGSWRVRVEGWDWFKGGAGNGSYAFPHSLLLLSIGQKRKKFDWRVEGAQDAILLLPRDAAVPGPQGQLGLGGTYYAANGNGRNNVNAFVKQAYVDIHHLGRGDLQVGRFEFLDGTEVIPKDATLATLVKTRIAQRLIGNFGWSAVGRSYDGARFNYNLGAADLTLFAARPTQGVFQIDGMGEVDADVYYGSLTWPTGAKTHASELRVFGLGYIDHRTSVLKTDNRTLAERSADHGEIQIGTYGADYLHVFNTVAAGKFDFLLWGALQTGAWGQLTQRAGAFVGEFGWQPPVETLRPWFSVGYSYGSGDSNPGDSVHGTFFQVLPTPRPYARFPFYDMENNEDFYGSLNLHPCPDLSVRSEVHALRLANQSDLWYLGGGVFQPKTFGYVGRPSNGHRSLANVWDLSADYKVNRSLGITVYYGHAWGKAVIASIYPNSQSGQFAYVETNVHF